MGRRKLAIVGFCALVSLCPASAPGISVKLDYTYDTSGLFPLGSAARASIQAAADYFSGILNDTFVPVTVPAPYASQVFGGVVSWELTFRHPSTDESFGIGQATIAEDEYRIFVGGRSMSGDTAGVGGFGLWSRYTNGQGFTQAEFNQYVQIRDAFETAVSKRGESIGFATWGGSISFDTDTDQNWHFDHTTPPADGTIDLYSVAIHELGHALGLGSSDEWEYFVQGAGNAAYFTGETAWDEFGGPVPLAYYEAGGFLYADTAHWREDTTSVVFGSSSAQEAAMDPSITDGTRKRLTALDAAALSDIGWTVVPPMSLPGDYNGDKVVDVADYTVWRNNFGSSESLLNDDSPGVDYDDYARWKTNFGSVGTQGGGSMAHGLPIVPEPSSSLLAVAGVVILLTLRRSLRRRLAGRFA